MVDSRYVLALGLSQPDFNAATTALPSGAQLVAASCHRQVMEGDYFALLLSSPALEISAIAQLQRFFAEADGTSTLKIFLGKDSDALGQCTRSLEFYDMSSLLPLLPDLLKKAQARAKRQESLTRSMALSFLILSRIQETPGITTQMLAHQMHRSTAAIRRYIEELVRQKATYSVAC